MEFLDPIAAHFGKIFLHSGMGRIQLRHFRLIGEAGITGRFSLLRPFYRKAEIVKPVCISGSIPMLHHIVKRGEIPAAMVEYPINDDAHTSVMDGLCQFQEVRIRAHAGIHVEIVHNIIFVIFPGLKNRIQVQAGKSQLLNVIKIFHNALNGTPQTAFAHRAVRRLQLFSHAAEPGLPVCKAVRENIVDNGIQKPFRRPDDFRTQDIRILVVFTPPLNNKAILHHQIRHILMEFIRIIPDIFPSLFQPEKITDPAGTRLDSPLIKIKQLIAVTPLHGDGRKAYR